MCLLCKEKLNGWNLKTHLNSETHRKKAASWQFNRGQWPPWLDGKDAPRTYRRSRRRRRNARCFDVETGAVVRALRHGDMVGAVAFSRCGRRILAGCIDGKALRR